MPKIKLEIDFDLDEVLKFATEKHKGQKRESGVDYIVHPMRVAKLVDEYKAKNSLNRKILIASAILHDTLEDTYTSFRELKEKFGETVASIVLELTTSPYGSKVIGKGLYLAEKMQYMTNYALTIKLADRLDNIRDLSACSEEKQKRTIKDTEYILDYLEKRRTLTKPQKALKDEIRKELDVLKVNTKI